MTENNPMDQDIYEDVSEVHEQQDQDQIDDNEDNNLPPVKKTPKDYILERQARKRREAEDKARQLEEELALLKEDPSTHQRMDMNQDFLEHTRALERKLEIRDFLADYPQFRPYQEKMLQWSLHEAYARIPVEQLAYAVAGKDLMKMRQNLESQAEREALSSQVLGGSVQSSEPPRPKGVHEMSQAEFQAYVQSVKRGI